MKTNLFAIPQLAALLILAHGARAQHVIYTRGVTSFGDVSQEYLPAGPSGSATGPSIFSYSVPYVNIAGYVDYNAIHVTTDLDAIDTKDTYASGGAQGFFVDRITIEAPELAGKSGTVVWEYVVEGSISAGGQYKPAEFDAFAEYVSDLQLRPVTGQTYRFRLYPNGSSATGQGMTENILNQKLQISNGIAFGSSFEVYWNLATGCRGATKFSQSGHVNISGSMKVVKVLDAAGHEVTNYKLTSESGAHYGPRRLWGAASDLIVNETLDQASEAESINKTVPQWSYGHRAGAAGTDIVRFSAANHSNAVLGADAIDGFIDESRGLVVGVNVSTANVVLQGEAQPAAPLLPGQMVLRPGSNGSHAVVRWTAPEKGTYNIAARWIDLDASGGDGAVAHVVKNGIEVAGQPARLDPAHPEPPGFTGFPFPNGEAASMPPQSLRFEAGEPLDFVLGGGSDKTADLTAFNAVIRRAPDVTIAAPGLSCATDETTRVTSCTAVAGQDVAINATASPDLVGMALYANGRGVGNDTTAPFEFILPQIEAGIYHLQAEGVDSAAVLGASNVITLAVREAAAPAARAQRATEGNQGAKAASVGVTYRAAGGFWSEPAAWIRQSDQQHAVGVPGPNDVAIISRSFQIVLNGDVTVKKLYCEGVIRGDAANTARVLSVTDQFALSGYMSDLTVNVPAGGLFTNVRGYASMENVKLDVSGDILLTQHLFASGSDLTSNGTLTLQAPPANGGPLLASFNNVQLNGSYDVGAGTVLAGGTMVAAGAGNFLGNNGGQMVAAGAGNLVGNNSNTLVAAGAGNLVAAGAGNLVAAGAGNLIGNNGNTLVGPDGATLVGPDGATLAAVAGGTMVAAGAGNLRAPYSMDDGGRPEVAASSDATAGDLVLDGGTVGGTGNLVGNVVNRSSFVAPGQSAGAIRVVGNYTQQSDGALVLEVGGTVANPPQYDQLQVLGAATLGGKLIVKMIDNFTPQSGQTFSPLTYTSVSGAFSSVTSNAQISFGADGMTMQVSGPNPPAPKALNISTRMRVETGDNALIAGFIITGGAPKKVIIRGIGPSLPVSGSLADPTLSLDGGATTNDNWQSDQKSEIEATGIAPQSALESAIVATLDPGPHTAVLRGKNNGTGVGLVEVYDLESGTPVQLANISTRGQVQTGDNVMIGGFIIGGTYPAKVLLRAIGPSLAAAGVPGTLADPTLELVDSNGNVIGNDNWRETQAAEIIATTVPPTNEREAAIVAILVPGSYTAVVRGKDNTTGVALVEGYNLQ